MRKMLWFAGISALALVAAIGPAPAEESAISRHARVTAEVAYPARVLHARHLKRRRASAVSRRTVEPRDVLVYRRGKRPGYWASDGTDQLIQCLLSQPFVICP
jgi:hypothetical protein